MLFVLLSTALLFLGSSAQTASPYTDSASGITFNGLQDASGFTFGFALPENPSTDFIGQIIAPVNTTGGWGGVSLGSSMANKLLIVAWPNGEDVVTSFRKASGYTSPAVYTGNFSMTPISKGTYVNDTAFAYTFLCSGCVTGDDLSFSTSDETAVFGWAWSDDAVTSPTSSSSTLTYHAAGFGLFGASLANAKSADYSSWASMASATNSTNSTIPTTGGGATNGTTSTNTTATVSNATYDYIIAGAGPAGIIVAEKLTESGASVLLVERGGPSLYSTGNNDTLTWNSTITMYDVPGVDYYLSLVGSPAYCTDTASQAGCLLGGGTMVNAMMFVRPQDKDFDDSWPAGWKWADVEEAANRLYERNPGQLYGSEDKIRYDDQAYDVLSEFLSGNGFTSVDALREPNKKTNVYSHPPWNLADGLRSGPVRTYLPLAESKSNFKLQMNTMVVRAIRNGSTISGVEVEDASGDRVIINVNDGGSVILAAGAMSTPRILFNSGIGPTEQIHIVANGSTGVTLPPQSDWINLPVGSEIKDHPIFTVKFSTDVNMPALATTAFTNPNDTTVDLFAKGSGLLSQSGQRLNFWTNVKTSDGSTMYIQGTCNGPANNTISMKVYLTHGLKSSGSLGITADGATEFITEPWLTSDTDKEAATIFLDSLLGYTQKANSTLKFLSGGTAGNITGNVTGADLLAGYTTGSHFVATAKMGTDDGRDGGSAVVDTETKVYGTDNLFVVDASMHPDLPTGNTQAIVMVAAEAAAAKILALRGANSTSNSTAETSSVADLTAVSQPTSASIMATSTVAAGVTSRPAGHSFLHNRPTTLRKVTPPAHPTPKNHAKREVASRVEKGEFRGRLPIAPEAVDADEDSIVRAKKERASFLDSY